jgi:hypothetical protein
LRLPRRLIIRRLRHRHHRPPHLERRHRPPHLERHHKHHREHREVRRRWERKGCVLIVIIHCVQMRYIVVVVGQKCVKMCIWGIVTAVSMTSAWARGEVSVCGARGVAWEEASTDKSRRPRGWECLWGEGGGGVSSFPDTFFREGEKEEEKRSLRAWAGMGWRMRPERNICP